MNAGRVLSMFKYSMLLLDIPRHQKDDSAGLLVVNQKRPRLLALDDTTAASEDIARVAFPEGFAARVPFPGLEVAAPPTLCNYLGNRHSELLLQCVIEVDQRPAERLGRPSTSRRFSCPSHANDINGLLVGLRARRPIDVSILRGAKPSSFTPNLP